MKRLFCFLLFATSLFGQYASIPMRQVGNGTSCSLPNVVAGNIGIVATSWEGTASVVSVTSSRGTWTQVFSDLTDTARISIWVTTFASSGADTVVGTYTGAGFVNSQCFEFPSWALTTTVDVSNKATTATSPTNVPIVTTTANNDFVLIYAGGNHNAGSFSTPAASLGSTWQIGETGGSDSSGTWFSIAGNAGSFGGFSLNTDTSATIVTLAFKAPALAINTGTKLPDGVAGASYTYKLLSSGGSGTLTWSITSGSLPTGLALTASTGNITGTIGAGASNNYNITFRVTDGTNTATQAMTFKVAASAPTPSFVQGRSGSANTLAFLSNVTSGNLIVLATPASFTAANICTDTLGTTLLPYARSSSGNTGSFNNASLTIYAGIATATGADTISCVTPIYNIGEFHNISFISNEGVVSNNTSTASTTASSGTFTSLSPNTLLLMGCDAFGSVVTSVNSPFTAVSSTAINTIGYDVSSSVTTYSGNCTVPSSTWDVTLFGARAGGGTVVISSSAPFTWLFN